MNPRLLDLLLQQRASGFPDMAGAHASAMFPVSDRLVTRLLQAQIPDGALVREVDVRAHEGNRLTVRGRLTRPAFLPPIALGLVIERQPELPESPIMVLHVTTLGGLFGLAGTAAKMFKLLPPGIGMDGQRVTVDLRVLLAQQDLADVIDYLEHLQVLAEEGRFVVSVRGSVRGEVEELEEGAPQP